MLTIAWVSKVDFFPHKTQQINKWINSGELANTEGLNSPVPPSKICLLYVLLFVSRHRPGESMRLMKNPSQSLTCLLLSTRANGIIWQCGLECGWTFSLYFQPRIRSLIFCFMFVHTYLCLLDIYYSRS